MVKSMKIVKIIPATLALGLLAACSSVFNGPNQALTVEEEHPISVEQQTVTLTLAVDPSLSELTSVDKARLRAFAGTYFTRGHGPLTITAPSGGEFDFYGQEMASDIRQELNRLGIEWAKINGATYRVSANAPTVDVMVTFSNYVASSVECGDWSQEAPRRYRNLRTKNFGCFSQQNLAAMISDPRDLVAPALVSDNDAARAGDVYNKFVTGEPTSSAADESIDIEVAQ